jgi:hypothetical protein
MDWEEVNMLNDLTSTFTLVDDFITDVNLVSLKSKKQYIALQTLVYDVKTFGALFSSMFSEMNDRYLFAHLSKKSKTEICMISLDGLARSATASFD